MSVNDVEFIQSFVRRYINKEVKAHFLDVSGDDDSSLSLNAPRSAIKRICLHKDTDPIMLTTIRLLFWWVEAKGLFNDVIYGIPRTDFDISNTYYPQLKLHFIESKYDASINNRRPARGEVSVRWIETDYTTANINRLVNKVVADFVSPVFFYQRGVEFWTYADKSKGYYFQLKVDSETTAKKVISQAMGLQEIDSPDFEAYLRIHNDKKNYNLQETIKVMGETIKMPKKRPKAKVEFAYAELFINGLPKPIILVDRTGTKAKALKYV